MPRRIRSTARPRKKTFIREWREFRGLTQDVLADRLHMSKAQLSRIETGKQPYTQDFLEVCAESLKTEPASLLMRNPKEEDALWSIWDQAKPGERRQITELAKAITKKAG
jgi:transcriptional regulator with XRE-family HTH domain